MRFACWDSSYFLQDKNRSPPERFLSGCGSRQTICFVYECVLYSPHEKYISKKTSLYFYYWHCAGCVLCLSRQLPYPYDKRHPLPCLRHDTRCYRAFYIELLRLFLLPPFGYTCPHTDCIPPVQKFSQYKQESKRYCFNHLRHHCFHRLSCAYNFFLYPLTIAIICAILPLFYK